MNPKSKGVKAVKDNWKFSVYPNGVTVWLNGFWIIDASCIKTDGIFMLDQTRTKKQWMPRGSRNSLFRVTPIKKSRRGKKCQ